jgi:hypothetical protein
MRSRPDGFQYIYEDAQRNRFAQVARDTWQIRAVSEAERRGADRPTAIRHMMRAYLEGMEANEPVHTWPGI